MASPFTPASIPAGVFNGGTVSNAVIVDQGFGSEGDFQEGDVYLFAKAGTADAELSAQGASAFVRVQQNPAQTTMRPIQYRDITSAAISYFYVDHHGTIVTRSITAPTDGSMSSGSLAMYLDSTDGVGNTKVLFKAKSADGTVKTAEIVLA